MPMAKRERPKTKHVLLLAVARAALPLPRALPAAVCATPGPRACARGLGLEAGGGAAPRVRALRWRLAAPLSVSVSQSHTDSA